VAERFFSRTKLALDDGAKRAEVVVDNLPNALGPDGQITVGGDVSEAPHLMPGNLGVAIL